MTREELLHLMNNRKQHCTLEILDIDTCETRVVSTFEQVVEAPNWTPDGNTLLVNSEGRMLAVDIATGAQHTLDTGIATLCNNDHVLSRDGSLLAVSHMTQEDLRSRIYILPAAGGEARLVTPNGPSYLHGWSPDGTTLAYCAERNGQYDIWTIPAAGGDERQLTNLPGLDDGPEYSPCGKYIWFNSTRSGLMQIWRMDQDGGHPVRMTDEEANGWFPHVSPDGKLVAYIAYRTDELAPHEHLPDKHVQLRLMSAEGGPSRMLLELDGGQGTINVNSWSPDSRHLAFVRY